MAQVSMFPPQSNSPVTELAADISSTDTTVMVVAGNLLPAAPNVATIGLDELAETIYYATKNGNELSGVIRGYDGTSPKGWNAGTRIARYLTAQDISALQHNVSDHETRINGISTATINKIEPRLVDDLPALYPIGLSLFSLTLEASAPWKTAIGHSGSGQTTLVQTAKANDDQYSIVQRVTFSTASGIEAMYERSSTVNNSWNGAWIKVVSRSEFDQLSTDVSAHLADYAKKTLKVFDVDGYGAIKNSAAIQAAMNAAEAVGGGIVVASAGTYEIVNSVHIPSNVTLIATKATVFKRVADINVCFINKSDGTIGGYDAAKNIVIIGGVFDGNATEYPTPCTQVAFGHCSNITVKDAVFKNTPVWHDLELNAVKNAFVENCNFSNHSEGSSEFLQIDFSELQPFPFFGPYDQTPCDSITIENCTFENGVDGVGSHSFIANIVHKNIKIINNTFRKLSGIAVKTLNYDTLEVASNYFNDCFEGIRITTTSATCYGINITKNIMESMKYSEAFSRGIYVLSNNEKGVISSNIIRDVGRNGLNIEGVTDWIVSDNVVTGSGATGIYIHGSSDIVVSNNRSTGNNKKALGASDLSIGFNSGIIADHVLVIGNRVARTAIQHTSNIVITSNILDAAVTVSTGNTAQNIVNNLINNVWA